MLLRLTRKLWGTGKVVILDSGFCVLQGLIKLKRKGVFVTVLIKKCCYWPKHIDGDRIKNHFNDKEVGSVDAVKGCLDDIPFYVFGMKEPDYVTMMMSMYGTLERMGYEKSRHIENNKRIVFKYPEIIHNHYQN